MTLRPTLYPLKFQPRFVEKIWGGRKLSTVLGKALPDGKQIGESWELYDFPPGIVESSPGWVSSVIVNGPLAGRTLHEAVGEFGVQLLGDVPLVGPHGQFPILIKFLDAREDLSIQVHPDREYAAANPGAHLKTEAWYVLQSDPGSRVLNGLRPGTTRQEFEAALGRGDVERRIRSAPAKPGDCFYLPSGTAHALGAGILVAEVQTPSDTTFRVFDFNRIDPSTGKPRPLHVDQALACIDFRGRADDIGPNDATCRLVTCPYFHLERFQLTAGSQRPALAGLSVLVVIEGAVEIHCEQTDAPVTAACGDVVLLAAALRHPRFRTASSCTWLEVGLLAGGETHALES